MATFDRRLIYHFDWILFAMTLAIGAVGIISLFSATYRGPGKVLDPLVVRQLVWLGVGIALAVAAAGSRRWINLGLFKLEPSELAKLALVLVLVRYLREDPPRGGWRLHQLI